MEDSFNPYTHWLNIPAGHPSNHYELLGLPLGENDSRAIAQAADTAIAQVRRIRPGNRLYEWKQVLDTLEQAKTCLLDPEAKADYDGRLRGFVGHDPTIPPASPVVPGAKMAVPPSPAPYTPPRRPAQSQAVPSPASLPQGSLPPGNENPPPATIPVGSPLSPSNQPALPRGIPVPPAGSLPPQASPLAHEPPTTEVSATPALKSVKRKKRSARRYWILGALIVWLLVLGGAVYYAVDQVTQRLEAMHLAQSQAVLVEEDVSPLPSSRQVPSPKHVPPKPQPQKTQPRETPPQKPSPPETSNPQASTPPASPQPREKKPEPKTDPARAKAFRQAMTQARSAMARREWNTARRHVNDALTKVQNDSEKEELDRVSILLDYVVEFWKGLTEGVARLESGNELVFQHKGKPVRIAIVEATSDELTFRHEGQNRTYEVAALPYPLALAIARKLFAQDPSSDILIGAFVVVDPRGDPSEARRLWKRAAQAGMDVARLMPELTRPNPHSTQAAPSRMAPPKDHVKLRQAEKVVQETFAQEFADARSAFQQAALARRLLETAIQTRDDPEARFVLFREARQWAVRSGKVPLACEVIDQTAKIFTFDVFNMKVETLETLSKQVRGASGQKEIATACLALIPEAVETDRKPDARRLARLATAAARKAKSPSLLKQAAEAARQLQE